jgi:streptogramin lyase
MRNIPSRKTVAAMAGANVSLALMVGVPFATPSHARASSRPADAAVDTIANVGFSSPENLVYDPQANVYLVANINGQPRALDANGFISRVSPDGKVLNLKWIDGSRAATRLDGPKGLAIHGDTLAVADIGVVRFFNRRTGASLGVRIVPGQLMNDVAFGSDGSLYVTDTGPDAGKPDTVDHDAIYRLLPGSIKTIAKSDDLFGPDGIVVQANGIVYATFKGNRVEHIATSGARHTIATLPGDQIDGLRQLPDRSYVVTSWGAKSVYRMQPNGSLKSIMSGVKSPAGVAYDTRNHTLAITSMQGNAMYLLPMR